MCVFKSSPVSALTIKAFMCRSFCLSGMTIRSRLADPRTMLAHTAMAALSYMHAGYEHLTPVPMLGLTHHWASTSDLQKSTCHLLPQEQRCVLYPPIPSSPSLLGPPLFFSEGNRAFFFYILKLSVAWLSCHVLDGVWPFMRYQGRNSTQVVCRGGPLWQAIRVTPLLSSLSV